MSRNAKRLSPYSPSVTAQRSAEDRLRDPQRRALDGVGLGQRREQRAEFAEHFLLDGVAQRVDVGVVRVKGAAVDARLLAQLFYGDALDRFPAQKLGERAADEQPRHPRAAVVCNVFHISSLPSTVCVGYVG